MCRSRMERRRLQYRLFQQAISRRSLVRNSVPMSLAATWRESQPFRNRLFRQVPSRYSLRDLFRQTHPLESLGQAPLSFRYFRQETSPSSRSAPSLRRSLPRDMTFHSDSWRFGHPFPNLRQEGRAPYPQYQRSPSLVMRKPVSRSSAQRLHRSSRRVLFQPRHWPRNLPPPLLLSRQGKYRPPPRLRSL